MKTFLKIFAVFLLFFYAENSMAASITLCGETYKLDVPFFSNKTVSFTDKYGDKVSVYKLTNDFLNEVDNRTKNIELKNEYYIYVKDNKTFAISHNKSFIFLDYNFDSCNFNKDIEKTNKIKPFSTALGFDYSNVLGFDMDFGYLGDNDSVGKYGLDISINDDENSKKYVNQNALNDDLIKMIEDAKSKNASFIIPKQQEGQNEDDDYDKVLLDNASFNKYMIRTLSDTLSNGINAINIEPYTFIREPVYNEDYIEDYKLVYTYKEEEYPYNIFSYTTPLMMAVYAGYNDIANYLLAHGANPAYNNGEADALFFAVISNNKEMIYKLVEAGAPVMLDSYYSSDALCFALYGQYVGMEMLFKDIIKEFLDEKEIKYLMSRAYVVDDTLNLQSEEKSGNYNNIEKAAKENNKKVNNNEFKTSIKEEVIPLNKVDLDKFLSKHYKTQELQHIQYVYNNNHDSYLALSLLLKNGYLDIADEFLKGIKPNNYLTSVIINNLALSGRIENLKFLDKYNLKITDNNSAVANVYIYDNNKFLAYKMAEYLLENGADTNSFADIGTALAGVWNKESFDLLYKYNIDLDIVILVTDRFCGTCLSALAYNHDFALAKYLLQKGANPFAPNDNYKEYAVSPYCKIHDVTASINDIYSDADYFGEFPEREINEYKRAVIKYSYKYLINDNKVNHDFKSLFEAGRADLFPQTIEEYINAFDYHNLDNIDINSMQYTYTEKNGNYIEIIAPYISALLLDKHEDSNVMDTDTDELKSLSKAYIYSIINLGADMEAVDTRGKNALDYIVSELKEISYIPYSDMISYASAYIYRDGQDKKTAVNNLMAAVKRAGLQQDDNYFTKYVYKMYDRFNQ